MYLTHYPIPYSGPEEKPTPLKYTAILTDNNVKDYKVGIGDERTVVDLFRFRPGEHMMVPMVRHGIIAAMPGEPIPGPVGPEGKEPDVTAYLAELRSTSGLSASPVFVNLALGRHADGTCNRAGSIALLGVIRGHWQIRHKATNQLSDDEMAANTGISMVTSGQLPAGHP
jgi:hypothetical protein